MKSFQLVSIVSIIFAGHSLAIYPFFDTLSNDFEHNQRYSYVNNDTKKTVFLIDGSSFLYRAYYGLKPLHTSKGIPVQAVYSFIRMIKKLSDTFKPSHLAIVWDSKGKTTRHELFPDYKATRQAPPSDIFDQKKRIMEFADLVGIAQIATPGIEADDIMYSIALEQVKEGNDVVFITSDKDMAQAINGNITMFDPFKDIFITGNSYKEQKGLSVDKIPFYFALIGDTSDNIPGVKGIGEKSAVELVNQFSSLDDLYANLDRVTKDRVKNALVANKENAYLSYNLFLLQFRPTGLTGQNLVYDPQKWVQAKPLFEELEFKSFLKDIEKGQAIEQGVLPEVAQKMVDYTFITVNTLEQMNHVIAQIKQKKLFAFDTETDGLSPLEVHCVGISLCTQEGIAYYIPFGHHTIELQLTCDEVVSALKPIFEDPQYKKIVHHANFDLLVMAKLGITVQGVIFDTLIAANLVAKDWQKKGLKYLSEFYLGEPMLSFAEVVKNNKYKDFSYVPLELATKYAAADAHQTFRLKAILERELKNEHLLQLFDEIEMPISEILVQMELSGILLDVHFLEQLATRVNHDLEVIEQKIAAIVGESYSTLNLNSPRQVEQLLFTQLQLPPKKKSAKGTGYSTDQEVLQELAKIHPVPGLIMKHRELSKLKSTYIDALPTYVNSRTGRIHTSFNQTTTATGRLASSDPNLQNIPTDTTGYGIEIRAAFKPEPGHVFISADYSQIELRVLAYLSQDENLLQAFAQGVDIHSQTAARLFDMPLEQVTNAQRQIGKRINFSILYGLTPYGLSKDLDIPFSQAKIYIDKYFAQYPKVSVWMEQIIVDTKHQGYVSTLFGRRRYIPAIHEKNRPMYEEARRMAINTVAQGTAAEIMKLGMITLSKKLKELGLGHIVLQIHDELLISAPREHAHEIEQLAKEVLSHVVSWNVPLEVTTRIGDDWKEITK